MNFIRNDSWDFDDYSSSTHVVLGVLRFKICI